MSEDIKRRDFLKLVSLGGAATVLSNCTQPVEKVIPYLIKEEDITPGLATYFATVCRECPAGCGMIVRTREGRAIKAEGNPDHPVNEGKLCMRGQASMQGLYNPDRFRQAMRVEAGKLAPVTWDAALGDVAEKIAAAAGTPNSVAYVGGLETGSFESLIGDFMGAVGSDARYQYEAISYAPLRRASQRVFGEDAVPFHDLSKAKFILSFGADYLETWLSPVEHTRQFAASRTYRNGQMGMAVYVGPRMSLTAANADNWLSIRPGQELNVALSVLNFIVNNGLAKQDIGNAKSIADAYAVERVAALAGVDAAEIERYARLAASLPSVVLAGVNVAHAEELAVVVNLINFALGNVGRTVQFGPNQTQGSAKANLDVLLARMNAGEIKVLVLNEVNPAFTLPASAKWEEAVAKVPYVVVLTPYPSETALRANVVLATHTPYEQWNDYSPREGVRGLLQPVMRPVFDTRHPGDILLALSRKLTPEAALASTYEEYLRNRWRAEHAKAGDAKPFERFFDEALQRGGVWASVEPKPVSLKSGVADIDVKAPSIEGAAVVAYPTIQFYDGRLANRPWLQEVPDPLTRLAWQSWIEVNPRTAKKLGVKDGDVLEVKTSGGVIEAPTYVFRGIREDVFGVPIGQGHGADFGRYAGEVHSSKGWLDAGPGTRGANPYAVLPAAALLAGAEVRKTGKSAPVVDMQGADSQHGRGIAQLVPIGQVEMLARDQAGHSKTNATALRDDPVHGMREWEPGTVEYRTAGQQGDQPGQNFYEPHDHPEYRWGMAIDLNSCVGCGACSVACSAENNVPVVGPELAGKGREMAWLWIDRYYVEDEGDDPAMQFIPVLCQHCDNAPCEAVCPVYATYHSPEGLNTQIYNRCVGTRYCGNNCPYKVRRFNWFEYEWPSPLHLQLNPDVSVRSKGVMEKCTFCVQRTREARDLARDENRPVRDGEVTTACAQTCPANAIVFGDLKDPNSRVSQISRNPRGYRVLEELATQPAITYLAEIVHKP